MNELDPKRGSVTIRPDGKLSIRPSEINRCIRGLLLSLHHHTPEPFDDHTLKIMRMGNHLEPLAIHEFEEYYGGKIQRQVRMSLPIEDWGIIEGTSDGVWFIDESLIDETKFHTVFNNTFFDPFTIHYTEKYTKQPLCYLAEVKAPGDSPFLTMKKDGPIKNYKWQTSCYFHMAEHTLGIKLQGIVFILCRRGDGEPHREFFDSPFYTLEQVIERCKEIKNAVDNHIKDTVPNIKCDNPSHFCKWWRFHDRKEDAAGQAATKNKEYEFDGSLKELALNYYEASNQKSELEIIESGLKEELEQAMHGREKVKTPGFSLYFGSKKFTNLNKLIEDRPDLVAKYTKFDADKALEENPGLKEKYQLDGPKFLTVRPVKKELEKMEIELKKPVVKKPKSANSVGEEDFMQGQF